MNKQTVKFSDQIATQKSQISALKKELETYRTDTKAAEEQKQTAEVTKSSYESLMTVVSHYSTGDMSNSALAEEACANAFFSIAKCFKKIHNYSLHDMDAYLIRTIRNACYAIYNKENQNPTSSIFDLKVEDEPSEDFYDDIDLDLLIDAVRSWMIN